MANLSTVLIRHVYRRLSSVWVDIDQASGTRPFVGPIIFAYRLLLIARCSPPILHSWLSAFPAAASSVLIILDINAMVENSIAGL